MSGAHGGRTNDLIRRFESLALKQQNSGLAAAQKTERVLARTSPPPVVQQAAPLRALSGLEPVLEDQAVTTTAPPPQPPAAATAAARFPELEQTPPYRPVTERDMHRSDQLRPSLTTGGFSVSPLSPKSLPPTKYGGGSSSPLDDLIGINLSSNTRKQSQGAPSRLRSSTADSLQPATAQRKRSLVTDLNQRAQIDRSITASTKMWLKTAERCMDEARLDKQRGELENAYVKFMKSSTIITDIAPKLRDFDRRDSVYIRLRGELGRTVLNELEELSLELKQRPYPVKGRDDEGHAMTPEQVEAMEDSFANKFPEHPSEPSWTPPQQAAAAQHHQQASYNSVSTIDDVMYNEHSSKFREIDKQVRMIDMSGPQIRNSLSATPTMQAATSPVVTAAAALVYSHGSGSNSASPPPAVPYAPANMVTCTAQELWDMMQKSRVSVGGRPSILILDVRVHQDFVWGHIDHRHIVNIDPVGMRSGCSSKDIEKSLVLVSEEQQDWFRRRDEFDIVVYMDQSSRNSNEKGLRELVAAIYHYEVEKTLRHSPLLLIGGMDGWEKEVGVDKCLWSSEAASMKHNNAAAPNIASMLSYHTPTGSLSNARQFQTYEGERQQQQQQHQHQHQHQQYAPVPDLYRYQPQMYQSQPQPLLQQQMLQQPQASVGSVGSVYDFFQQNSNYRRQWQTEGYMQTSNVSYTPGYNNVQTVVPQAMMVYPSGVAGAGRMGGAGQVMTAASAVTAEQPGVVKPLPEIPGAASRVQRRKTVFDNPVYGFTGSTAGEETSQQQAPLPPAVSTAVPPVPQIPTVHQARIEVSQDAQPAQIPSIPPKPAAYQQQQEQEQQKEEERPQEEELQARPAAPAVIKRRRTPPAAPLPALPPGGAAARKFYANPVAAGSDPSLNGRMHTGGVIRSQAGVALDQGSAGKKAVEDAGGYGSTGLKNFGNTCFMNCIIQCLAGTTPFVRYFRQGHWKRDMVGARGRDVAVEFARLVDTMWSGQYGSLSPIAFRKAVGCQSEQFKGNEQEDAQEFAVFLLDALHEALNTINPRPPADKELSAEDERVFERLVDARQAQFSWDRYVRRNWSIVTSIFQGQAQSRLTCLTCHHTSTTYATFTELSVPVPAGSNSKTPIDIYRCLAAYAEIETLDGDDRWKCPNCKAKRRATKRLLISRLPLVLIVHLKRFSTIGHFREKLETHVAFPTRHLQVGAYAVDGVEGSTAYNLYAVANHFGTLSGGHYTASVFNGLRQNWNYYDDTRVSTIKEADVATPAAYLLFYVRAQ